MDKSEPGYKGFKDYSPFLLRTYDPWVVGFMAPRVWKMGAGPGIALYEEHMGRSHLDVGPGTGYFIAEAHPPTDTDLTLLDANPHVLDYCSKKLAAWSPKTVESNILRPLPLDQTFDSAALAHVIHCLPGPMAAKSGAVEHVAAVLEDDGVLFGGTVLGLSADHTRAGRLFLRLANRQGGFDNRDDSVEGLRSILDAWFQRVHIEVPSGSVAYFVASHPRR